MMKKMKKTASSEPTPGAALAEEEPTASLSAVESAASQSTPVPPPCPEKQGAAIPGIAADSTNCDTTPDNRDDGESSDIPPLVINTDAPSSPPPPHSSNDVTPPLTEETNPDTAHVEDTAEAEDRPPASSSPGLDIPPESSNLQPLLTVLPASPTSPDRPSTPSSSSSQADASGSKQKRGTKIMPVQGNDGASLYQCPICKEKLKGNHELTAHIRSHNNVQGKKPNTCTICFKELSSQSSLDRHMLVHSGERPFSCKVCGMSFTTNGNMHRHTRIHNKEDIKAANNLFNKSKPTKSKTSSAVPLAPKPTFISPATSLIPTTTTTTLSSWHRPGVYNPDRSASMKPMSGVDLKKLMASGSEGFQLPRNPFPTAFLGNCKRSFSVLEKDGPSPAKQRRECEEESMECGQPLSECGQSSDARGIDLSAASSGSLERSAVKESSGAPSAAKAKGKKALTAKAGEEGQKLHRTSLPNNFLFPGQHLTHAAVAPVSGKMPLLNHHESATIASGAASSSSENGKPGSFQCSKCGELCESQCQLEFHMMLVHLTNQQAEDLITQSIGPNNRDTAHKEGAAAENMDATKEENVEPAEERITGFHDLNFMDVTSTKFPLVAKALCEEVPRKSASRFHNFQCKKCPCSFPCESALKLHQPSHASHSVVKCPECDCHFLDPHKLYTHMYTHTMHDVFDASRHTRTEKGESAHELMEQKHFLGMFELIGKENMMKPNDANRVMIEKVSKQQNNKYHAKVQEVYGNWKTQESADSISDGDKDADHVQRECSSSVVTTFHRSMSPSSDTPRMSASAPPADRPSLWKGMGLMTSKLADSGLASSVPSALQTMNFAAPNVSGEESAMNGTNGHLEKDQTKEEFQCSICKSQFTTKRAFKGHVRSHHQGSQKHLCAACPYRSSDKSTLIRHMRTHTGQRPYECKVCAVGFTTKANCERHIRKRHGFVAKEDMEHYMILREFAEGLSDSGSAHSTVCKYCGEDFKFLPALHLHMKSHINQDLKPFVCVLCSRRLATKAQAVNHVQAHHNEEIIHKDIETLIKMTPPVNYSSDFPDMDDDSFGARFNTATPSPASTPGMEPTPPNAHSTPVFETGSTKLPSLLESPLDFSKKKAVLAAHMSGALQLLDGSVMAEDEEEDEAPMDLSTKGRSTPSSSLSSVSSSPSPSTPILSVQGNPLLKATGGLGMAAILPCLLCKKTFTTQESLNQHLFTTHQISPTSFTLLPPSDNNNNNSADATTALLPLSLMPGFPLSPLILQQARAAGVPLVPTHPAFPTANNLHIASMLAQRSLAPLLAPGAPPSSTPPPPAKESSVTLSLKPSTPTTSTSNGSESSCDLASVHKIVESATNQNLRVFLKPQTVNSASEDSEPAAMWDSPDEEDSNQSLDKLYKQSLNGPIVIKKEVETKAGGPLLHSVAGSSSDEAGQDSSVTEAVAAACSALGSPIKTETDVNCSKSPKTKTSPNSESGKKTPNAAKKKRNSYADSPHKMKCPHCPRMFPWISSLNRHMLTHTGQKPFTCPRCNVTFSTKSNRERHLTRKHGVDNLDPASRQTMDRPYKCHLCVFSSFSTENNLLKHYKERHPGVNPPDRYLRGEITDEILADSMEEEEDHSSMEGCSEHNSMDAEDADTSIPNSVKAGVKTLVENVVTNLIKNKPKPSPSPSKDTPTPTDTTQSGMADNEEDSNDNEMMPSSDIPLTPGGGSTERHVNPERDNYNVDKITFCWFCGEQFTSRKLVVRHLKEHNIDLPFKCYLCDASYDTRFECLTHQEKSHPSDWAVLKDKNGVGSIEDYSERLDRIVERNCKTGQFVEEGEEEEGGVQTMTTAMTATTITGEDGQNESVASDYLQRKVYCSLCSKRFWSLQDLRRHMRSHTGERPFACDKCDKRFTLKHSMMRHRRKHVSNTNGDSPAAFSDDEDDVQLSETSGKAPASHMGTGHKALRQHLAAAAGLKPAPTANIPTTVLENNNSLLSLQNADDNKDNDNEDDMGEDMLHNLLGVESETIDQIIDKKDSAATLLGVKNVLA
ncbi:hypothetical protein ACOMHN_032837 [Nucella lapillus]